MTPATTQPSTETHPTSGWGAQGLRPRILVLVTTVVAIAAAVVYAGARSIHYEATANVLVAPLASEDPNFQGLPLIRESSDGSRPVQTAAGLLSGPSIARLTAAALGWTTSEVEEDVTVQPRGESNIVAITSSTESADEAARLANLYARVSLEHRRSVLEPYLRREIGILSGVEGTEEQLKQLRAAKVNGDPTLSMVLRAEPPTSAAGPSTKRILLVALIVGLLVGIGAVLVINVARSPATSP